jgi:signal transduction histidine kinase
MQCNFATAVAAASSLLTAYVAISLTGFIRVARRRQQRLFFFIAGSAGLYCLLDVASAQVASAPARLGFGIGQALLAGVHAALWIRCAGEELGPLPGRLQRAAEVAAVAVALVALAAAPSAAGRSFAALPVLVAAALALPLVRYARAASSRGSDAWLLCAAIAMLVLGAAGDALATGFALPGPYLFFDSGLAASSCLVGLALSRRWSSDLRALDELPASLERRVNERTQAREHAWHALSRADRLAAMGRLAAGMAHEINNPGSALIANMEYLLDAGARQGTLPPDALQTLQDSLTAAKRITSTVRQLLLVSRVATGDRGEATFNVAFAIDQAVRTVEQALGKRVAIRVVAPKNIVARGRGLLLEQALAQLITNGILAVPKDRQDGEVRVVAEFWDGVLVLQVIDNGIGMDEAVTQRLFEPFFTTRPPGDGAGLGLAVSLGLLQALGGEVRVESKPGVGTTMTLVLEASTEPLAPDQETP